ncbi:MAG: 3-deoxy-manno-octulosonate cytidylyltransferase [Nitrospinae bacterium]|nr:3-deoxy-manno-octulosonate cytidylyltransferase [Nitrospinota bacterium]
MKVIAIIPARYASIRFPGKPLAEIHGKPLIQHVWERVSKASLVSRVIVATDDERIFEKVRRFGGEVWMTSRHHRTGTDRISEVAKKIEGDIIVNVQGDEPLIRPKVIDTAVEPFFESPLPPFAKGGEGGFFQMGTICTEIKDEDEFKNPNIVKVVFDRNEYALYFSRSPVPYNRDTQGNPPSPPFNKGGWGGFKHIGLYVYRRDFLLRFSELPPTPLEEIERLEQLRVLENGYKIKIIKTDYDSIGVDTPEDLEKVKQAMSNGQRAMSKTLT